MAVNSYNCACGGFFTEVPGKVSTCPDTGNQLRLNVCSKCAGLVNLTPVKETPYKCESCNHEGVMREPVKGGIPDIPTPMKLGEVMYFEGINYGQD